MSLNKLLLSPRTSVKKRTDPQRKIFSGLGLQIEHVTINKAMDVEFRWSGNLHYLAIHQMTMKDGETRVTDMKPFRLLDLRRRLTYLPPTADISGWSRFPSGTNSVTTITFDLSMVAHGHFDRAKDNLHPMVYFIDPILNETMNKLHELLQGEDDPDPILLETLGVLAIAELALGATDGRRGGHGRKLSIHQQRLLTEYVEANISRTITLGELAGVLHLSRFYFTRCFSATFGTTPYKYVLMKRIEKSKELLLQTGMSVSAISDAAGFASASQFSSLFKRITKLTPREFRSRHR